MYFCHEYMHICIFEGSAYLHVSDCIWLYFAVRIFMYLTVFWGHINTHMHQFCGFYWDKSAASSSAPHENQSSSSAYTVARDSNPDMNEMGRCWEDDLAPVGAGPAVESVRGAASLEITIRKSLITRHSSCPWRFALSDRWTTRNLARTRLPALLEGRACSWASCELPVTWADSHLVPT